MECMIEVYIDLKENIENIKKAFFFYPKKYGFFPYTNKRKRNIDQPSYCGFFVNENQKQMFHLKKISKKNRYFFFYRNKNSS